jgi:hypothetical protein
MMTTEAVAVILMQARSRTNTLPEAVTVEEPQAVTVEESQALTVEES